MLDPDLSARVCFLPGVAADHPILDSCVKGLWTRLDTCATSHWWRAQMQRNGFVLTLDLESSIKRVCLRVRTGFS